MPANNRGLNAKGLPLFTLHFAGTWTLSSHICQSIQSLSPSWEQSPGKEHGNGAEETPRAEV